MRTFGASQLPLFRVSACFLWTFCWGRGCCRNNPGVRCAAQSSSSGPKGEGRPHLALEPVLYLGVREWNFSVTWSWGTCSHFSQLIITIVLMLFVKFIRGKGIELNTAKCFQAGCNWTLATIVLERYGSFLFVWSSLGSGVFSNLFSYLAPGGELQSQKRPSQDSNLACSLTNPSLSVQQFRPPVSFPETQHFGSAFLRRSCVGKGSGGGVLELGSAKPPWGSPHSSGCLTHCLLPLCLQAALLIQPWEVSALAAPLTPFVDTAPECSGSSLSCNPGSRGWGQGSAGPCAGGFPLACPRGLGASYLLSSCSSHRPYCKCFAISSEEGGWQMRTWKVLSISLLSLRMLYFRGNVGLNNSCISLLLVKLQP